MVAVGDADEGDAVFAGAGGGLFYGQGAGRKRQARTRIDQRGATALVHDAPHGRTDGAARAQVAVEKRPARQAMGSEAMAFREDQRAGGAVGHRRVGASGGQAGRRQFGFHGVLHGGAGVIVGQVFGRELGEDRIGLHRQVIQRQVFGAERDSLAQIGHTGVQRLARQGEHHVQVHPRDGALRHADGGAGLIGIMDAPQLLQLGIVETLDAQREARDATGRVVAKAAGLGGAGVRLHAIRPALPTTAGWACRHR
ncbi:hypothetical protein G6F22_015946 [Rhizopus arrhizus]|nr:hypothetical protein G6F22_015946 [Rhizopus arrhizus]